jgi:hypothetical protein
MLLEPKEVQTCAYLFQKTNDTTLMLEIIIKVDKIYASMVDLQCLLPT